MGDLAQFTHDEPTRLRYSVNDKAGERARELINRKEPEQWEEHGISASRIRDILKRNLTPSFGELFVIAKAFGLIITAYVDKES